MQFNYFSATGALLVLLLLAPNVVYAVRGPGMVNRCKTVPLLVAEQIGRYGCMALMVLPLGVWEFRFSSRAVFILWCIVAAALVCGYYICWLFYFRAPSPPVALWLAILPSALFVLRGIALRHWLLVACGVLFAIAHISITYYNNKPGAGNK